MDEALRQQAREAGAHIRDGTLRGARLLEALLAVPFIERDVWIDEALGLDAIPDDVPDLPRGAVPYVPCNVDAIVRAVLDAPVRARDVFVDLGCGVGRVAVLVHLLTGARVAGIDLQAPLIERGRAMVHALALDDVHLAIGDAAQNETALGTVYFIYASFSPAVLARVLAWLERVASTRPIVLCAVGFPVLGQAWLRERASRSPELALYDSLP
ncbi:MAG TPA: class I SAM-dependent methyltransferase [Myxococcota bacterium]